MILEPNCLAAKRREGGGALKRKGLFGAVTLLFLFCLVAIAAGQMIPGQPDGPRQPNIPVLPGTPDLTGASAPLSLPAGQRYEIRPYVFRHGAVHEQRLLDEYERRSPTGSLPSARASGLPSTIPPSVPISRATSVTTGMPTRPRRTTGASTAPSDSDTTPPRSSPSG